MNDNSCKPFTKIQQPIMKKNEIIREIAARTGFRVADVKEVYTCFDDIICETILGEGALETSAIEIGCRMMPEKEGHWDGISKKYITIPPRKSPYVKMKRSFYMKYYELRRTRMLEE